MTVQFVCPQGDAPRIDVEYGWGDARVPIDDERIVVDGSDPAFPAGQYRVSSVYWALGLRGPQKATVYLRRLS